MHQLSRRRIIYLIAIVLGFPVLVHAWMANQASDPFQRYAHPLQAMFLIWAFTTLWRAPTSVPRVERATYWTLCLLWLGNYTFGLHTGQAFEVGWTQFTSTVMLNFFVLSVLSHLMFTTRTGLRINVTVLVTCFVVGLARLLPEAMRAVHVAELNALIGFFIALAVVVGFLYVLARSKDDHLEAELEARALGEFAFKDQLTGLPNRWHLTAELERLVEMGGRYERPLSLIIFDLDHFKQVNDRYGHPIGDEVLIRVAECATKSRRQSDIVGRWGGEEFLILAPETEAREAEVLAERIRQEIELCSYPRGLQVTASFGVRTLEPGMSGEELLLEVDQLLYSAKHGGRNRVVGAKEPSTEGDSTQGVL